MILCKESEREILIAYLKEEAVRNTFFIGDILNYGFESELQSVWADFDGEDCRAIYLWFCKNLLIYSKEEVLKEPSIKELLEMKKPDQIMAKTCHLNQIHPFLEGYQLHKKSIYGLENSLEVEKPRGVNVQKAKRQDADRLYDFLQSGELAPLYRAKKMIEKRLETGEGIHYFIEQEGKIVAQVNSAASTPYTVMIGGVYTAPNYRGNRFASYLVGKLCQELKEEGKIPCLISDAEMNIEKNLYVKMGFKRIDDFNMIELAEM